jgi:hypothetical protein
VLDKLLSLLSNKSMPRTTHCRNYSLPRQQEKFRIARSSSRGSAYRVWARWWQN